MFVDPEAAPERVIFAADPLTVPEMLYVVVVVVAVAVKFTPAWEAPFIDMDAVDGVKV